MVTVFCGKSVHVLHKRALYLAITKQLEWARHTCKEWNIKLMVGYHNLVFKKNLLTCKFCKKKKIIFFCNSLALCGNAPILCCNSLTLCCNSPILYCISTSAKSQQKHVAFHRNFVATHRHFVATYRHFVPTHRHFVGTHRYFVATHRHFVATH